MINIYDNLKMKQKFKFQNEFKLTNWNEFEKGQPWLGAPYRQQEYMISLCEIIKAFSDVLLYTWMTSILYTYLPVYSCREGTTIFIQPDPITSLMLTNERYTGPL